MENHHHLLHRTLEKIASKSRNSIKVYETEIAPEQNLFNKRAVKNALSRNTSLSVCEKLNLYKTYEDAVKHDQSLVLQEQAKIVSKLSISRPPIPKDCNQKANKNLVIIKAPSGSTLQRKSVMIESKDKLNNSTLDKSLHTPFLPSLPSLRVSRNLNASFCAPKKLLTQVNSSSLSQNNNLMSMTTSFLTPNRANGSKRDSLSSERQEKSDLDLSKSFNAEISPPKSTLRRMNLKLCPGTLKMFMSQKVNKKKVSDATLLNPMSGFENRRLKVTKKIS